MGRYSIMLVVLALSIGCAQILARAEVTGPSETNPTVHDLEEMLRTISNSASLEERDAVVKKARQELSQGATRIHDRQDADELLEAQISEARALIPSDTAEFKTKGTEAADLLSDTMGLLLLVDEAKCVEIIDKMEHDAKQSIATIGQGLQDEIQNNVDGIAYKTISVKELEFIISMRRNSRSDVVRASVVRVIRYAMQKSPNYSADRGFATLEELLLKSPSKEVNRSILYHAKGLGSINNDKTAAFLTRIAAQTGEEDQKRAAELIIRDLSPAATKRGGSP